MLPKHKDAKEELIKQLIEVSAEIMNIPQEFFMITNKELSDENIGIGGKSIGSIKANYIKE